MHPEYKDIPLTDGVTDLERLRLVQLQEELAESIVVLAKILRFGWTSTHPASGKPNWERLQEELEDVNVAVGLLHDASGFKSY